MNFLNANRVLRLSLSMANHNPRHIHLIVTHVIESKSTRIIQNGFSIKTTSKQEEE